MTEKEYKDKIYEIRLKIMYLPLKERENQNHIYYQMLNEVKHEYTKFLFDKRWKEMENEENDKHKRR